MLSEKKRDIMLARISRLAKKYGPFVRFFPNGSEEPHEETPVEDVKPEEGGSALESAIKDGEKAAKTPEEQKAIDDARKSEQQVEQERANAERANEAAKQAQSALETAQTENAQLQEQLEAAEVKAAAAGIKDVELDESKYETTDIPLVRAIKSLNEKLEASNKRSAALEKKAKAYEQQVEQDTATSARNTAYKSLLTDLDGEYGADCRNEAVKKFQAMIKAGEVPKNSPTKATRAIEKCYKEVKAAKDKAAKDTKGKSKSSLSLDTGSGGGSTPNLIGAEIKEGSLDEVDAQIAKTEIGARKP